MFGHRTPWIPPPIRIIINNRWGEFFKYLKRTGHFDVIWFGNEFNMFSDYHRLFLPQITITIANFNFHIIFEFLKKEVYFLETGKYRYE
jgi:hypothetical protein